MKFSLFRKLLVVIVFFCIGLLCCDNMANRSLRSELRDLRLRLSQSEERADTFIIHDSIPVYRERIVEVDRTDYKRILADEELIKSLRLRLSQVESEHRALLESRDTVYLSPVLDSVLYYKDKWSTFTYCTSGNRLEYSVRDSLSTIVSRVYKHKFLWFRWGVKGYDVSIVSHNPHCHVEWSKYIRVVK